MSESLLLNGNEFQLTNYENEFALLRLNKEKTPDSFHLPALGKAILDKQFAFIDEVIATEVEICLKLNDLFQQESIAELSNLKISEQTSIDSPIFQAPIHFSDQSDNWSAICQHTNLTQDEYIEQILDCQFHVAMFGFLPGFLYLGGLAADLHVPRKETPEKRTVTNAFAIGGKYAGIYSLPSPAGWNVVGNLAVDLLDAERIPPLLVNPNDSIQLQRIDDAEYQKLIRQRISILEYNGFSHIH